MNRLAVALLSLALLAAPPAVEAQPAGKVYRIGLITPGSPTVSGPYLQVLRERLADLGYVEGKNVGFEVRHSNGVVELLSPLAEELVGLHVDLIVAWANSAILAAKQTTTTIPIVMGVSANPVQVGLVANLARPGGNVTGVSSEVGPEIAGKMLQLLKEAAPNISRVGILLGVTPGVHSWTDRSGAVLVDPVMGAARSLGLSLVPVRVKGPNELQDVFTTLRTAHVDALLVDNSFVTFVHRLPIIQAAAAHRLPAIYTFAESAREGGLLAYASDLKEMSRQAASYVDKILKGAKPADLPVEQPSKFNLVVNRKTARALGLTIPQSVLLHATDVIE